MEEIRQEWDFYFCKVEGAMASIMLDLAWYSLCPIQEKNALIQISVHLNHPDERGLTVPSEAEVLFVMEDLLAAHLATSLGGIYVARNTSNSKRIFYYYCNSMVDHEGVVAEIMDQFPYYQYTSQAFQDEEWSLYRDFLYPTSAEYHAILNRRAIDQLMREGTNLEEEYKITHFAAFPDSMSIDPLLIHFQNQGFEIDSRKNGDPYSRELNLTRIDALQKVHLDKVVMQLVKEVEAAGGKYKGWKLNDPVETRFGVED